MKKKALYGAAAAAVFCALAAGLWCVWQASRPETSQGMKTVTVEVTHSDQTTREFTCRTDLEYLGELLKREGLISGSEGEFGIFVDTVDGETADYSKNQGWWSLTCNGEPAETGVESVVLRDGDVYGWTYTTG